MPKNFELISTVTVGSGGASSIDFTSIPQTFTDLQLVVSSRVARSGQNWAGLAIKINGTTFNNQKFLYGTGSATSSSSADLYSAGASNTTASTTSTFSNNSIYIADYTSSTNKTISTDSVTEQNGSAALQTLAAAVFTVTSAITSITLVDEVPNTLQQYTTASLYGILKGSGGATVS